MSHITDPNMQTYFPDRMVLDRSPVSEPVKQFAFSDRIYALEFSPYDWSSSLLALGLADSVVIGQIKFPEEEEEEIEVRACFLQNACFNTNSFGKVL